MKAAELWQIFCLAGFNFDKPRLRNLLQGIAQLDGSDAPTQPTLKAKNQARFPDSLDDLIAGLPIAKQPKLTQIKIRNERLVRHGFRVSPQINGIHINSTGICAGQADNLRP